MACACMNCTTRGCRQPCAVQLSLPMPCAASPITESRGYAELYPRRDNRQPGGGQPPQESWVRPARMTGHVWERLRVAKVPVLREYEQCAELRRGLPHEAGPGPKDFGVREFTGTRPRLPPANAVFKRPRTARTHARTHARSCALRRGSHNLLGFGAGISPRGGVIAPTQPKHTHTHQTPGHQ